MDKFEVVDIQWCSEVPRGQDKPIELVRGLETSRKFFGLAKPMQCMHGLDSPEISPGGLKTSNQLYGLVLAPRNLAVPLEVHEHKLVQSFHGLHTVGGVWPDISTML